MKVSVHDTYEQMSQFAADEILSVITSNHKALLCLATGDTPKLTYKLLVEKILSQKIDISQIQFVGLDEWVGVPPTNPGSCHFFLHKNLFVPLTVAAKNIHLFDALSNDLNDECKKMNDFVTRYGGIDLMLLGVGTNGHVGLNEPGDSEKNYAHVSKLAQSTIEVGQKYFKEQTGLDKGLTFGLANFLESKRVMMLANGFKKNNIIKRIINDSVSEQLPSTLVRKHKNATLILDREAAPLEK